jgi:TetR/AcrR family transcriptional regulator
VIYIVVEIKGLTMKHVKAPPPELARRLVSASEEVLRPGGEMRLEDVAALVGSARATLYYYFSGRDDLIAFLLQEHVTAASEAIAEAAHPGQPPGAQLRSAVTALAQFLGRHPGVCAGLLSFAGAAGQLRSVMAAKDDMLAAPIQRILEEGATAGQFSVADTADAANAILGAAMIAIIARWDRGADSTAAAFQQALTDQIIRGVQRS